MNDDRDDADQVGATASWPSLLVYTLLAMVLVGLGGWWMGRGP